METDRITSGIEVQTSIRNIINMNVGTNQIRCNFERVADVGYPHIIPRK